VRITFLNTEKRTFSRSSSKQTNISRVRLTLPCCGYYHFLFQRMKAFFGFKDFRTRPPVLKVSEKNTRSSILFHWTLMILSPAFRLAARDTICFSRSRTSKCKVCIRVRLASILAQFWKEVRVIF